MSKIRLWRDGIEHYLHLRISLLISEFITAKSFQRVLNTKFAEIGFAMHAKAALDEMKALSNEFKILADNTSVKTPNIDKLNSYIS